MSLQLNRQTSTDFQAKRATSRAVHLYLYLYISLYLYIYTHIHIHIYVYIYIHIQIDIVASAEIMEESIDKPMQHEMDMQTVILGFRV